MMSKFLTLLFLFSCCLQHEGGKELRQKPEGILIVYLSRTNNTKVLAEIIQEQVGGTLVSLQLVKPYPDDYDAIVKQVAKENETGFLPPLKTRVTMDQYDTVFLGFPTWGMQLPPPMKSYLHEYDLADKTIIPFNTHAGYGVGSGFQQIRQLCESSVVMKGLSLKGGIERDGIYLAITGEKRREAELEVISWLNELNILEPR
jgi:flavodoxin